MSRLVLYVARDCHLCELAREELVLLRVELGFELEEVDVTGDPELEARYRRWLPVGELDGERVFAYRVEQNELRRALAAR